MKHGPNEGFSYFLFTFGELSVGTGSPSLCFDYVCAPFCLRFNRFEKFNNARLFYVYVTFRQHFTGGKVGRSHFAWTCHRAFCKTRSDFCFLQVAGVFAAA